MELNVERAADQIDVLISRRIAEREQANWELDAWERSARLHAEAVRERRRAEWAAFHRAQARRIRTTSEALVRYHEGRASSLEGMADAP